jgi:hypothetical protein
MPGFGEFLGKTGEAAWQLFVWQIGAQVVGTLLLPYLTELGYLENEAHPNIVLPVGSLVDGAIKGNIGFPQAAADAKKLGIDGARFAQLVENSTPRLTPADLAQLVIRAGISQSDAEAEAFRSGLDPDRFDKLLKIAADAPGPQQLAEALRRGIITEDSGGAGTVSFLQGIREGRLGTQWAPMLKALAVQWPTPADALEALLEGQISESQAKALYERFGGDPEFFTMLFNTRGNAPTPVEALDLLNRGIIAERGTGPAATSYEQAFLEGPWRNKWLEPFLGLRVYVTPPRSVVAQLNNGSITPERAAQELAKSGLDKQSIAEYIHEGTQVTVKADKDLTDSAVTELYTDGVIERADALNLWEALGYSKESANLKGTLADLRQAIAQARATVSRVHTLYVGHKIKREAAVKVLNDLAIPDKQVTAMLANWDIEAGVNIRQLTESQIVQAWVRTVIDQSEAMDELQTIGYTPYDAWVLLSIANKAPLEGRPAKGPSPIGVIP